MNPGLQTLGHYYPNIFLSSINLYNKCNTGCCHRMIDSWDNKATCIHKRSLALGILHIQKPSHNLGQNSCEKFYLKHHLAPTDKIYWSSPPPHPSHTNADNVMQNTVQAFGRCLNQHWNGGRGESRNN